MGTQWIRLNLQSCCPRFESQAHQLWIFLSNIVLYLPLYCNQDEKQRGQVSPILKNYRTDKFIVKLYNLNWLKNTENKQ